MPGPLLGLLARVGAGLAARVGAAGTARALVGMARQAGTSAAKRAAAKAAASAAAGKGAAAATTAAAQGAGAAASAAPSAAGAGGMRVLENTTLNNARSLFQAIYGQTPAAGASTAASTAAATPAAAAAGSAPATAAAQAQAAAQAATNAAAAAPAAAGAPAATSGAGAGVPPATPSAPPASPGSTPPSNPKPTSILDRAVDVYNRGKAIYEQQRGRYTPIADQVAGMSMDQRYDRLKNAGKLLDPLVVGRQSGTPNPSQSQIVGASEAEEERMRQQEIQSSRSAQVGQAAWSAGKRAAIAGLNVAASPGSVMVTGPAVMYSLIQGFERLGRVISETNRDLTKFNSRIADSFARLDYAQMRSRQQVASATSGSGAFLNDQLTQLVREVQPIRETVTSFMNMAGSSIVFTARALAFIIKWHPAFMAMRSAAGAAEKWFGKREGEMAQAATKEMLRNVRDGKFNFPRNPVPGGKP